MQRAILRINRNPHEEMQTKALLFLIENNEESEVVNTVDALRRAGVLVVIAGVNGKEAVECVKKIRIVPDVELSRLESEVFDCVIVPGGSGAEKILDNELACKLIRKHVEANKVVASICAGTKVLNELKIGWGKKIAVYPMYKDELSKNYKCDEKARTVTDGNLVTSQGPATAFEFGLAIADLLCNNKNVAKDAANELLCCY